MAFRSPKRTVRPCPPKLLAACKNSTVWQLPSWRLTACPLCARLRRRLLFMTGTVTVQGILLGILLYVQQLSLHDAGHYLRMFELFFSLCLKLCLLWCIFHAKHKNCQDSEEYHTIFAQVVRRFGFWARLHALAVSFARHLAHYLGNVCAHREVHFCFYFMPLVKLLDVVKGIITPVLNERSTR